MATSVKAASGGLLPWPVAPLGSLGRWTGGGTPSKSDPSYWTNGTIPWVSAKDMKTAIISRTVDLITEEAVTRSSAKRIPAGSVLCVMRSGILAHTFPVAVNAIEVTINQDLRALVVSREVDARFLAHFLRFSSSDILQECSKHGTTVSSVEASRLDRFPVPLPPIETQRCIVARIDELFSELDDGEEALRRARADLATYRKSLLKAAVTGELTADWRIDRKAGESGKNLLRRIAGMKRSPFVERDGPANLPDGWAWAQIGDLIYGLRNGVSNKPANFPPGQPILRISAVREMRVNPQDRRWLAMEVDTSSATVQSGQLLFTRYNGSPDLVGVCGCYRAETAIAFPDKLMRADPVVATPTMVDYIEIATNAGHTRKFIAEGTKTSAGQHGVSGATIKSAPVPVPPPDEISEIVQRVAQGLRSAAIQSATDAEVRDRAATLRQSILAAAFRGELVQ